MKNQIAFRVYGKYAMFTDPVTRMGGEKFTYQIPTYEAIKGVVKSIYWKPTLIWHVDSVRVINKIQTQTKGTKPKNWTGGNTLAIYTFLHNVEYEVKAHFEWNEHRPELVKDRIDGKHFSIAKRMLERGGRQDIFLGTRDCQAYVEPCDYGVKPSYYDDTDELSFGIMFHSFGYPDETGKDELTARYNKATLKNGEILYSHTDECSYSTVLREMKAKSFGLNENLQSVDDEESSL